MKKLLALMLIFSMFFVIGCSEDDVDEFDTLVTYLEEDNYINNMGSWIMKESAPTLPLTDYFILDLRAAEDAAPKIGYNTVHIEGAKMSTLGTMFDDVVAAADKPILVTCYSGQTASFAHALLQMKGIEAYVMMFGMSLHDAAGVKDLWDAKCSDKNADQLVFDSSPDLPTFGYPELDTGEEDAEDILDARIDEAIAAWGAGLLVSSDDVIANPSAYNIMNYWPTSDVPTHEGNPYITLGHIDGAYQLIPNTLTQDENLSVFDPDGTNIFYCWTGQTAAAAIAYLNVLGYETKSIAYGFNNMNWSALNGHKFPKTP